MGFTTNAFIDKMLETSGFINGKRNTLENFRIVEDYLKKYRDKLNELDKACKDASLDSYKEIKDRLTSYLSRFDMDDLPSNIENIDIVISFLRANEAELGKISALLNHINNTWGAFIEKIKNKDKKEDPKFVNEMNIKIKKINDSFCSISLNDLSRTEVDAEKLKKEINEVINAFDFFTVTLDKYLFIGKEAKEVKAEISYFLENDFYKDSLGELSVRRKKIERLLDIIKKDGTKTKRKSFFVVRLKRKGKEDIHSYTIKAGDTILDNQESYNINDYNVEETGKKVYFDNYPAAGVFERVQLAKDLEVSKDHYKAIANLENFSYGIFNGIGVLLIILSFLVMNSTLNPFVLIASSVLFYFLFKFSFLSKKNAIDKKLKIPYSFYFIPVNWIVVKEGDEGLNIENLKLTLLINDELTFLKGE